MSREWRAGDVALVRLSARAEAETAWFDGSVWRVPNGGLVADPKEPPRPLALIDPENRKQVISLIARYCENYGGNYEPEGKHRLATNAMQKALRSLITPPKPEEPTGLGAVVETANGKRYVRWAEGFFDGRAWAPEDGAANALTWEHLNAVKVLSEGVTP